MTALVSTKSDCVDEINELVEEESHFELVDPLTPEGLRSYFREEPRVINLNRRGWGVTPANIREY